MSGIAVRVEPPGENPVVEVSYDGQEVTMPPLSMSEHLAKQARKIDFSQDTPGGIDTSGSASEAPESMEGVEVGEGAEDSGKSFQQPVWPWENCRNLLRSALTELCVASDVLSISTKECGKDRRYMVLDGPVQTEPVEQKPFVQLLAKKKALEVPAKILLGGAEHLRNLQNESKQGVRSQEDFHIELLRLRQNWRLKKVGNAILGDLSYKTAGSRFNQSGVFEVSKADSSSEEVPVQDKTDANGGKAKSALKVTVPSELEGIAYIQVTIQRDNEQLVSATLGQQLAGAGPKPSLELHWQNKLEAAQNVLFCKELFSQLAREAVGLQAPIPHMVVGSQITASLFPDIQLIISLCHSSGRQGSERQGAPGSQQPSKDDHSHVLEHSLHQLLRKVHHHNINPSGPCLSSAPVGIPRGRRAAGPGSADRAQLLAMADKESLLEQIVRQAQHVVLRLRSIFVLDTLAREFKDPLLTSHWSTLSSPTCSSVKVSIVSQGYDTLIKTQLVIHVGEKMLRVICKDGRVLKFSYEPQELRDFILCQISQHQVNGVQALAKVMGWQVLASSCFLGSGSVEPFGSAAGCLLANPKGDRFVAVRHSPQCTNASVHISKCPSTDFFPNSVITDRKWENLPASFKQLRLEKMDGKNLINKIELLMAALS